MVVMAAMVLSAVVAHGGFDESNSESDGRMVVGGNARLTSMGVATKLPWTPRGWISRSAAT